MVITENEIFNNEWSINNAATRQAEEFSAASFETLSERDIEPLEVMERRAIERALSISGGNITITANMLQVTRNTFITNEKVQFSRMIIFDQQMKISSAKKIGTAKKMRKRVHKILTSIKLQFANVCFEFDVKLTLCKCKCFSDLVLKLAYQLQVYM